MPEEGRKNTDREEPPINWDDFRKLALVLSIGALMFLTGFYLLVCYDVVRLYPKGWTEDKLRGFSLKAEYTLRYQSLLIFWLLFNVLATIYGRISNLAVNPLDDRTEPRVQMFKATLSNSYEQILISVMSQLIFVSFCDSSMVLKYIPFVNIIQFIGRIAFFAGYPMKRGFGFLLTVAPNLVLTVYNIYMLGSFVGLYGTYIQAA